MASPWEALVELYDKLRAAGKPVCPIAHTYISANIAILLDKDGNFLAAMRPPVHGEVVAVPCTIESEGRTSNVAPHLISDQIKYIADRPGQSAKHKAYIKQLKKYTENNSDDIYAKAVYNYVIKNTVMDDIKEVMTKKATIPIDNNNIVFAVYGLPEYDGKDLKWAEYYTKKLLPHTGMCSITGQPDYIPKTYPRDILYPGDRGRLFITRENPLDDYPKNAPGYIASQKAMHALQYMIYAADNAERVEAEYKIVDFLDGRLTEKELKRWVAKKYPGKAEKFFKILMEDKKNTAG